MGVFGFFLFESIWASWLWMSVSFPRLGKVLAIIYVNKFFSLSYFSFWDSYNVNVHLCGSVWYCLISLFGYLFFCCFDWLSPVALSLSSWILTSASSLLLNLSSVFFGSVTVFFSSVTICYFLVFFLYLCWSSHCVRPFFSQVWWASLWLLLWTHQVNRFIKVSILRF